MKKIFKYVFVSMLSASLLLSMAACGQEAVVETETESETETVVETESETETETKVKTIKVKLNDGGKESEVDTAAADIEGFLAEQKIKLGEKDSIDPADKKQPIKAQMVIMIERIEEKEVTESEVVPFETSYQYTDYLYSGESEVQTAGQNGEKKVTYKVTYKNGEEVSREVSGEEVVTAPVTEIILLGTYEEPVYVAPEPAPEVAPAPAPAPGKTIVSEENMDDCDGSGHGTKVITYSDGSQEFIRY